MNLRHSSIEENLENILRKFQVNITNSNRGINLQEIKLEKLVLNSYFLRNKAMNNIKDMA